MYFDGRFSQTSSTNLFYVTDKLMELILPIKTLKGASSTSISTFASVIHHHLDPSLNQNVSRSNTLTFPHITAELIGLHPQRERQRRRVQNFDFDKTIQHLYHLRLLMTRNFDQAQEYIIQELAKHLCSICSAIDEVLCSDGSGGNDRLSIAKLDPQDSVDFCLMTEIIQIRFFLKGSKYLPKFTSSNLKNKWL